jgi:hypothetical protein
MWLCHQGSHARQIRWLNADTGGGLLQVTGDMDGRGQSRSVAPVFLFRPACEISGAPAV